MRSLLRFLASSVSLVIGALALSKTPATTDLYFSSSHQSQAEAIVGALGPQVKMMPYSWGSPVLRVRIPSDETARAKIRLAGLGIEVVKELTNPLGFEGNNTLGGLKVMAAEARRRGKKKNPGYINALRHHIERRAYPFDRIDFDYHRSQAEHARQMPPRKMNYAAPLSMGPWTFIGPRDLDIPYTTYFGQRPLGGRTNAVAFDPANPSIMYAGGAMGGLWKSTDAGANWTPLSNAWSFQTVNCIAVLSSTEIWVGMGDLHGGLEYGHGIMKTTDGGATWTQIGASVFGTTVGVTRIEVVPGTSGNTIIAMNGGAPGYWGDIYRTTDRGANWTRVLDVSNMYWSSSSIGAPNGSGVRTIYAMSAGFGNGSNRLYRSQDQGVTWTAVPIPGISNSGFTWSYCVAASKINPGTVYVMAPTEQLVLKSDDFGATWTDITAGMPNALGSETTYNWSQFFYNYNLETSTVPAVGGGNVDVLYTSNIDLSAWSTRFGAGAAAWRSVGGPTWDGVNTRLHNDQHSFAVDPANPLNMLIGCDGGVYTLTYSSAANAYTITSRNATMGTHQFYHISAHPTDLNIVMGGTQDNATPHSRGNLNSWDNLGGGDGGYGAINWLDPNIQYITAQELVIFRTRNNWSSASYPAPDWASLGQTAPFISVLELNKANPSLVYAATNYLNLYTEGNPNGTWTYALGGTNFGAISAVGTCPSNASILYVGTTAGNLWRSANGGANWTRIDVSPLPDRPITEINASATDPNSILVTIGGSAAGRLYECTNTTAASPVWTHRGGAGGTALPDVPTNSVLRDPSDPVNKWWVANDLGVFSTIDRGATWSNATQPLGLPQLIVNKLTLAGSGRYMIAGTFGRGAYQLLLDVETLSSVTVSPTSVVGGLTSAGTVNLSSAAPPGGQVVNLSYTGPASGPASVTVPAGATSVGFTVNTTTTSANTNAVITATIGSTSKTATLTVVRALISSINVSPSPAPNASNTTGTVTLNGAVTTNTTVSLSYTPSANFASPPASVVVPTGSSTATFTFRSTVVPAGFAASVTGTLNGASFTRNFNVAPVVLEGVMVYPANAYYGQKVFGVVKLASPQPSPVTVAVASNSLDLLANQSVTIPAGRTFGVFSATIGAPASLANFTNVTLTSTLGPESRSDIFKVRPPSNALASGNNRTYSVGDGLTRDREFLSVVDFSQDVLQMVSAANATILLRADGTVWSVGRGDNGQHGDGTSGVGALKSSFSQITGLPPIIQIAATSSSVLALTATGEVFAWGRNNYGQTGQTPFGNTLVPTKIPSLSNIAQIAVNAFSGFALDVNGDIWSWGANISGSGGRGAGGNTAIPVKLTTVAGPFVELGVGSQTGYAIHADGSLYGWGLNTSGQLGNGNFVNQTTMVPLPISNAWQVSGGAQFGIVLRRPLLGASAQVLTTGANTFGERGIGSVGTPAESAWAPVAGGSSNASQIGAGFNHAFFIGSGQVRSWGAGSRGERGDGSFAATKGTPGINPESVSLSAVTAGALNSVGITAFRLKPRSEALVTNGTAVQSLDFRTGTATPLTLTIPAGHVVVGGGEVAASANTRDVVTMETATRALFFFPAQTATGATFGPLTSLGVTLGATEKVAAIANMDNAGRMDFVTVNSSTGAVVARLYSGTAQTGTYSLYTLGANETLAGVGDFNVDGHQDLLLYNTATRVLQVRLYRLGVFQGTASITNAPLTPAVPTPIPALPVGLLPLAAAETSSGYGYSIVLFNAGAFEVWKLSRFNLVASGLPGPAIPPGYSYVGFWR